MEKAFDRVSWRFLKRALTALRFTDRYTSWINMLYSDKYAPSRRVYTNGKLSEPYHIHVGTAQGCPLSPLLFLPIMEAFTRLVKADKELEGIRIGSNEYRIRHFADDTFGLLRNEHQIPRFSELIDVFCKGTNMRENESKREFVAMESCGLGKKCDLVCPSQALPRVGVGVRSTRRRTSGTPSGGENLSNE